MTRAVRDAGGFTLLELLAGIVVFGFVAVLLAQGLRFGVQASQLTSAEHEGDRLAVEQAVRRLVRAADPGIYPEPATLHGSSKMLELTTELPGGMGLGLRADAVLAVGAERLVLRWRRHQHVEWFGPGPAWNETVLADGVERAEFGYFTAGRAGGWASAWTGDRLPALVRLTVVFVNGGRPWPPIIVAPVRESLEE